MIVFVLVVDVNGFDDCNPTVGGITVLDLLWSGWTEIQRVVCLVPKLTRHLQKLSGQGSTRLNDSDVTKLYAIRNTHHPLPSVTTVATFESFQLMMKPQAMGIRF